MLAVNVGTPIQNQHLQELYSLFENTLVIVGCHCNNFGKQEPVDEKSIVRFCKKLWRDIPINRKNLDYGK